jgi:hypothetical protein
MAFFLYEQVWPTSERSLFGEHEATKYGFIRLTRSVAELSQIRFLRADKGAVSLARSG